MASYNIQEIGEEALSRYSEKLKLVNLDLCRYQIQQIFGKMIQKNDQH